MSIRVKSGIVCVVELVAACINAPESTNRAVITPGKGARTLVYCNSVSN